MEAVFSGGAGIDVAFWVGGDVVLVQYNTILPIIILSVLGPGGGGDTSHVKKKKTT